MGHLNQTSSEDSSSERVCEQWVRPLEVATPLGEVIAKDLLDGSQDGKYEQALERQFLAGHGKGQGVEGEV